MQIDLSGRVVLLTGGSRGIGAACVRALAGSGARVLFTYVQAQAAAESLAAEFSNAGVAAVQCDVSDAAALAGLVDGCIERFGSLDVVVNNAAIFAENPFDGSDFALWASGWKRTFAVNVFGAADLCWLAMRAWQRKARDERGIRGRIINITSRAAHRGELTFADYGASKAALGNLTKSIARSCAADGIVAFSIAPGFIETDMAAEALLADGASIRSEIPSGRVGTPEEVAGIVTFFASGLGDYATGTTIDVNGASYVR